MGNAPVAHLEREDATTFFWRFQYVQGHVDAPAGRHAWLTKEELAERLGGPLGALTQEMCGPMP